MSGSRQITFEVAFANIFTFLWRQKNGQASNKALNACLQLWWQTMTTKLIYNHKHTTYSQAYATWPSNENWTSEKRPAVTWQFYSHRHQRYNQQNGNINRKDQSIISNISLYQIYSANRRPDLSPRQGVYKFGKMKFPEFSMFSRPSKQSFPDNYKVKTRCNKSS